MCRMILEADIDVGGVAAEPSGRATRRRSARGGQCGSDVGPLGPSTFEEAVDFPAWVLPTLLEHVKQHATLDPLAALHGKTIVLTTSFSGIGSAEWAMAFIRHALARQGCNVVVRHHSACDTSTLCRSMLSKHASPPDHIFCDLMDKLEPEIVEQLVALQASFREKLPPLGSTSVKQHRHQVTDVGQRFLEAACELLRGYSSRADEIASWCSKCNSKCIAKPVALSDALWIEIGGNTCTPWSSSGARMGWLDESSLPSLAWGWWCRQGLPDIIINECVPAWPAAAFWQGMLHGLGYSHETVQLDPARMGLPCCRPRSYTIVACSSSVAIASLSDLLLGSTSKRLAMDASAYFRAPQDLQLSVKKAMLKKRHINLSDGIAADLPWSRVLCFGSRLRLEDHKRRALEKSDGKPALAMVSQTVPFAGSMRSVVPTLLRNSMCFDTTTGRMLLPIEHFVVNGIPLFCDILTPELVVIPQSAFEDLSISDARQLAGNMMHLASVGCALMAALCCHEHTRFST